MIVLVALRKELLEQWRTYRFLVVLATLTAFGFASPLLAKMMPQLFELIPGAEGFSQLIPSPTTRDAVDQYIRNTNQFGVLLGLLLAMGMVAQEKERGTLALVLVKPMPRWAVLAAKFAALGITFAASLTAASLAAYFYTFVLFEALPLGGWLALSGLLLLFVLVYAAFTLFASTLTRSQAVAGGMGFGLILLLAALAAIPTVGEYMPLQLMGWGAALALGQTPDPAWGALAVSVGIIVVSLVAAWAVFRRQEL